MADPLVRIAVWSGPRNLSTALMRSFAARGDTAVSDEPLYAAYLARTGLEHPMRDAVLASQPTDWRVVAERLARGRPTPVESSEVSERTGARIWYAKQMAHHLLPSMLDPSDGGEWWRPIRHALLIRHPARVIASYTAKRSDCTPEDLGVPQQIRLLDHLLASGRSPVVVDSAAIRLDPRKALERLCTGLGIPFSDRMLSWDPGPRPSDGVWAPHWYDAVFASHGFASPEETGPPEVSPRYRAVLDAVMPAWLRLSALAGT